MKHDTYRLRYWIMVEDIKDTEHQIDLKATSKLNTLEEAQKELATITDRYARIEKVEEEYTPPSFGRQYKDDEWGWSIVHSEVIEEN